MIKIITERLILRDFEITDVEAMYEYLSDDRVAIPAGGKSVDSLDKAKMTFERVSKRNDIWAIELKSKQKVIGAIGAYNLTYNNIKERHIGFELSYNYWNKGYVTEACKSLITYLFEVEQMDRIAMSNYHFNKGSIRVAEKLGFVREGALRKEDRLSTGEIVDRIVYSIIKDEYFDNLRLQWKIQL
ncbi:GNAT family protein [Mycoplasmatota bacterium WC44]